MDSVVLLLVCCIVGILIGAQIAPSPRIPPTFVVQVEPEAPHGNGCLTLLLLGGLVFFVLVILGAG